MTQTPSSPAGPARAADMSPDVPSATDGFLWQRFSVPFAYPVAFTRGLFAPENPILEQALGRGSPLGRRERVLVFVDEGVATAHPGLARAIETYFSAHDRRLDLLAAPIVVPGGERIKTELTHIEAMQEAIHTYRIDRHSHVLAVGGGAMLDCAGLAAATVHRGVRLTRVPTTVLSQNDSGVGVKNAVNFRGIKNYVGTFAPPWAVLNDFSFLAALSRAERISGVAEAVKVALIRDRAFFEWLEQNADALATFVPEAEEYMIRRCAELHMRQIALGGDPFEMGSARPLDYGHWSAHKLESLTRHRLGHGAAVAVGVALDTRYSVLAGHLEPGADERVAALLENLGFRIYHPALARSDPRGRPAVLAGLDEFREHLGGELTVTLLEEIGRGVEVHEIDPLLVEHALGWLAAREG